MLSVSQGYRSHSSSGNHWSPLISKRPLPAAHLLPTYILPVWPIRLVIYLAMTLSVNHVVVVTLVMPEIGLSCLVLIRLPSSHPTLR